MRQATNTTEEQEKRRLTENGAPLSQPAFASAWVATTAPASYPVLAKISVRALPGLLKANHAEYLKVERESERHRTEKETLANRELVKGHSLGRLL